MSAPGRFAGLRRGLRREIAAAVAVLAVVPPRMALAIAFACATTMVDCDPASSDTQAHAAGPIAWAAPSLVRIGHADPPGESTAASISAARSEYESFQIAVRAPTGGLTNVNAVASNLARPDGAVIDASDLTLYREHYVYVSRSSPNRGGRNRSMGAGWYPDALIPFRDPDSDVDLSGALDAVPFDLPEETNAVIWVDVYVPRRASAGDYSGRLVVTSDQGDVEVPLSVSVWDFALPRRPTLNSVFLLWTMKTLEAQRELLQHRFQPHKVAPQNQRLLISIEAGTSGRKPCSYGQSLILPEIVFCVPSEMAI